MYRDETAAHRQRLVELNQQVQAAWAALEQQRERVRIVSAQRSEAAPRGLDDLPVERPAAVAEPDPAASAAELVALCQAREAQADRLRSLEEHLRRAHEALVARAAGRAGALPLGPPPRSVPVSYFIGEWLGLSPMVILFGGFMGLPFGIAFGAQSPVVALLVAIVVVGGLAFFLVRARSRQRFLARCRVAKNVRVGSTSSGGSKYTNWPLPVAHGWQVKHESYTGSGVVTTLLFSTEEGQEASTEISGAPYVDGVVLYDPLTGRSECVSQLRSGPRPDIWGRWESGLSFAVWIRVALTAIIAAVIIVAPLLAAIAG